MKFSVPRSAPAIAIIAAIALMAGTGGAVAGSLVTSAKIKDGTIQSIDVKNGTLQSRDISKAARTALAGAGSARAYAAVNGDATLDAARSKNIARVSDFGTGHYCVFLDPSIDVTTVVAVVSLRGGSGWTDTAIYTWAGGCLEDAEAGVSVTTSSLAGAEKPAPFYLMVP